MLQTIALIVFLISLPGAIFFFIAAGWVIAKAVFKEMLKWDFDPF